MERELAKWILDISKYVVTALLLSTVFSDMSSGSVFVYGVVIAIVSLGLGLYILRNQDKKDERREKNRNKKNKGR